MACLINEFIVVSSLIICFLKEEPQMRLCTVLISINVLNSCIGTITLSLSL